MAYTAATAARRRGAGASIKWQRVGRLALLATLAAIVLLYIPPLVHWFTQHGTASRSNAQLQALQREHDSLKSQLDALSTNAGIARAAARLGMVRVGERPYVIQGPLPR